MFEEFGHESRVERMQAVARPFFAARRTRFVQSLEFSFEIRSVGTPTLAMPNDLAPLTSRRHPPDGGHF
jgi:hypothetical protein